ncbi:extracellular solute-binding protein [Candidatus Poribacteria bacterium]|nr:extracellular solute-binding protein [Candidatus Poribacteria bacterium]
MQKVHTHTKLLIILIGIALLSANFSYAQNNKLVLISPHQEGIRTEFENAFIEWYQGEGPVFVTSTGDKYHKADCHYLEKSAIRMTRKEAIAKGYTPCSVCQQVKLEWLDVGGGTSTIFRRIQSDFQRSPGGINIDLIFGGGTSIFLPLLEEGLLQPYKLPDEQLAKIPEELLGNRLYDAQYHWYGTAISAFGIMYNEMLRKRLKLPEVRTWTDLLNPKLQNRVGAADPRESGTAHMMYDLILQGHGWEEGFRILFEMAGNVKTFPAAASQIPQDVATGRVIYGFAIDFYAYQQIAAVGADKLGYVLPPDTAVFTPDSIAILKGAPNLKLAQKFVEFVLSQEGQKLWMLKKGEPDGPKQFNLNRGSVLPELYEKLGKRSSVPVNPFQFKSNFKYDFQKGGDLWTILNDLVGALIIDPHKELIAAWEAINASKNSKNKEAALKEFNKIPLSEQEALELAKGKWNEDTVLRNQKKVEWSNFAREKYRRAKELARGQ